ncbi:MAG: elongation factor Ts [Saprospiraceae bacterium]|jgi:elongation factor Ts
MGKISAADVKKLRDETGAGMMDCKKALVEADGDYQAAIDYLRKRGQKMAAKRVDRDAKEGVVLALTSHNRNNGIVMRLSCETDFVAKNESFVALTTSFAEIALKNLPDNIEAFMALPYGDEGITVGEKVIEQVAVVGEKLEITKYEKIETAAGEGQVIPYIHAGHRAGVLIALNQEGPSLIDAGKDVAMQVAAMRPTALDKDGIDATTIEREIQIGKDQARQEGKPEAMLEKIAMGRLNKFYKEKTLLNQAFVKSNKQSIQQYLDGVSKGLTVSDFKHVELG